MGPGFPFGEFDLNELWRMLQAPGPLNFEAARQTASTFATLDLETNQQRVEPTIDDATSAAFDQLVRAAQLMVAEATGLSETLTVATRCVDRKTWATLTLDGLASVLESLARALQPEATGQSGSTTEADDQGLQAEAFFGMLMQTLLPLLLGGWSGWMIGQLAHQALGQYDLPLPLEGAPVQLFVVHNIDAFAEEWSLPRDELRYALALREVVHGAQRTVPWVRERLSRLASAYVGAYEPRPDAFEEQLSGIDLNNPQSMESLSAVADAGALLSAMQSERQEPILADLQRFVSVLEGYTDVVVEMLGERMVTSHARIDEALRRHRLERGDAASFVDRLLGLQLDRRNYEEGVAFCRGVIERSGFEHLNRLWSSEAMVPTKAEFEAPGLWLARIELPES
jgi:putative hydrolase